MSRIWLCLIVATLCVGCHAMFGGKLVPGALSRGYKAAAVQGSKPLSDVLRDAFSEFSITGEVNLGFADKVTSGKYTSKMYLKFNENGVEDVQIMNEYRGKDGVTVSVLKDKKHYIAKKLPTGELETIACTAFSDSELTFEGATFPSLVENPKFGDCDDCTEMLTLFFDGRQFMVYLKGTQPVKLVARDVVYDIKQFESKGEWRAPDLDVQSCKLDMNEVAAKAQPTLVADMGEKPSIMVAFAEPSFTDMPSNFDRTYVAFKQQLMKSASRVKNDVNIDLYQVEQIVGKPSNGIYTVEGGWFSSNLYFKVVDNRIYWSPGDNVWMSCGTIVTTRGSYAGKTPTSSNIDKIKELHQIETGSKSGNVVPDTNWVGQYLLGNPDGKGVYTASLKDLLVFASKIYFRRNKVTQLWEWNPTGPAASQWYPPSQTVVNGAKVHSINQYTLQELDRINDLIVKGNAAPGTTTTATTSSAKCDEEWKGDGFCDPACNNAASGWDNGDCCPGTCTDSKYVCGSNKKIVGADPKPGYKCLRPTLEQKKCLFVHGLGRRGSYPGEVQDDSPPGAIDYDIPRYWADMKIELKGICSKVSYLHMDTSNYGWTDSKLQDFAYKQAKQVYADGGVIFAHSMGNLILAGACLTNPNRCDIKWNDAGGPIRGSQAAESGADLSWLLGKPSKGTYSMLPTKKYMIRDPDESSRDDLSQLIATKRLVLRVLCGKTGFGAGLATGRGLALAKTVAYGNYRCVKYGFDGECAEYIEIEADGFVGVWECAMYGYKDQKTKGWKTWYITGEEPSRDYKSKTFISLGNHQDMTGSNGNFDHTLDWYRYSAKQPQK